MTRSGGATPKHTEDANPIYLHGTPAEVAHRLEKGHPAHVTNFSQIAPNTRSARSGINDRSGKIVRNGKLGGDLRHSGD